MRFRLVYEKDGIIEFPPLDREIKNQIKGGLFTARKIFVKKGFAFPLIETECPGRKRVAVLLEFLGRQATVEMEAEALRRTGQGRFNFALSRSAGLQPA